MHNGLVPISFSNLNHGTRGGNCILESESFKKFVAADKSIFILSMGKSVEFLKIILKISPSS